MVSAPTTNGQFPAKTAILLWPKNKKHRPSLAHQLYAVLGNVFMARKKSVKQYLKVGSIIRTGLNEFWEVTCLLENKFQCRAVDFIGRDDEWTQEFYYNIDMIVFNESARNVA